jgi:hypothetical protein
MLTDYELKILNWIYQYCCKSFTVPFAWKNKKLILKTKTHTILKNFMFMLSILTPGFMLLRSRALFNNKTDVNSVFLFAILFIFNSTVVVYKLSIWLFREKLVRLINGVISMNSAWGKFSGKGTINHRK